MNFIKANVEKNTLTLNGHQIAINRSLDGIKEVVVGVRPESLFLSENVKCELKVKPDITEMLGSEKISYFDINGTKCAVKLPPDADANNEITLKFNPDNLLFFDVTTLNRI